MGRARADRVWFDRKVTLIQKHVRRFLLQRTLSKQLKKYNRAATLAQAAARSWMAAQQRDKDLWDRESNERKRLMHMLFSNARWLENAVETLHREAKAQGIDKKIEELEGEWRGLAFSMPEREMDYLNQQREFSTVEKPDERDESARVIYQQQLIALQTSRNLVTENKAEALFNFATKYRQLKLDLARQDEKIVDMVHRRTRIMERIAIDRADSFRVSIDRSMSSRDTEREGRERVCRVLFLPFAFLALPSLLLSLAFACLQRELMMKRAREKHVLMRRGAEEKRKWAISPYTDTGKPDVRKLALSKLIKAKQWEAAGKMVPKMLMDRGAEAAGIDVDTVTAEGLPSNYGSITNGNILALISVFHSAADDPEFKARIHRNQKEATRQLELHLRTFMMDYDRKHGNRFGGENIDSTSSFISPEIDFNALPGFGGDGGGNPFPNGYNHLAGKPNGLDLSTMIDNSVQMMRDKDGRSTVRPLKHREYTNKNGQLLLEDALYGDQEGTDRDDYGEEGGLGTAQSLDPEAQGDPVLSQYRAPRRKGRQAYKIAEVLSDVIDFEKLRRPPSNPGVDSIALEENENNLGGYAPPKGISFEATKTGPMLRARARDIRDAARHGVRNRFGGAGPDPNAGNHSQTRSSASDHVAWVRDQYGVRAQDGGDAVRMARAAIQGPPPGLTPVQYAQWMLQQAEVTGGADSSSPRSPLRGKSTGDFVGSSARRGIDGSNEVEANFVPVAAGGGSDHLASHVVQSVGGGGVFSMPSGGALPVLPRLDNQAGGGGNAAAAILNQIGAMGSPVPGGGGGSPGGGHGQSNFNPNAGPPPGSIPAQMQMPFSPALKTSVGGNFGAGRFNADQGVYSAGFNPSSLASPPPNLPRPIPAGANPGRNAGGSPGGGGGGNGGSPSAAFAIQPYDPQVAARNKAAASAAKIAKALVAYDEKGFEITDPQDPRYLGYRAYKDEKEADYNAERATDNNLGTRVNRLLALVSTINSEAETLQYGALLKPLFEGVSRVMVNAVAADGTAGAIALAAQVREKRDQEIQSNLEETRRVRQMEKEVQRRKDEAERKAGDVSTDESDKDDQGRQKYRGFDGRPMRDDDSDDDMFGGAERRRVIKKLAKAKERAKAEREERARKRREAGAATANASIGSPSASRPGTSGSMGGKTIDTRPSTAASNLSGKEPDLGSRTGGGHDPYRFGGADVKVDLDAPSSSLPASANASPMGRSKAKGISGLDPRAAAFIGTPGSTGTTGGGGGSSGSDGEGEEEEEKPPTRTRTFLLDEGRSDEEDDSPLFGKNGQQRKTKPKGPYSPDETEDELSPGGSPGQSPPGSRGKSAGSLTRSGRMGLANASRGNSSLYSSIAEARLHSAKSSIMLGPGAPGNKDPPPPPPKDSVRATESENQSTARSVGSFAERFNKTNNKDDQRARRKELIATPDSTAGAGRKGPKGEDLSKGTTLPSVNNNTKGTTPGGAGAAGPARTSNPGNGKSGVENAAYELFGPDESELKEQSQHSRFWSYYSKKQSDKAKIKREFEAMLQLKMQAEELSKARQQSRWEREREFVETMRKKKMQREAQMDLFGDIKGSVGQFGDIFKGSEGHAPSSGPSSRAGTTAKNRGGGGGVGAGGSTSTNASGGFFAPSGGLEMLATRPITPNVVSPPRAGRMTAAGAHQQMVLGFDLTAGGGGGAGNEPIEPSMVRLGTAASSSLDGGGSSVLSGGSSTFPSGGPSVTSSIPIPFGGKSHVRENPGRQPGSPSRRPPPASVAQTADPQASGIPWELLESLEDERSRMSTGFKGAGAGGAATHPHL